MDRSTPEQAVPKMFATDDFSDNNASLLIDKKRDSADRDGKAERGKGILQVSAREVEAYIQRVRLLLRPSSRQSLPKQESMPSRARRR